MATRLGSKMASYSSYRTEGTQMMMMGVKRLLRMKEDS